MLPGGRGKLENPLLCTGFEADGGGGMTKGEAPEVDPNPEEPVEFTDVMKSPKLNESLAFGGDGKEFIGFCVDENPESNRELLLEFDINEFIG